MNGPEHYAEAERLAELAMSPAGLAMTSDGFDVVGAAQVHATLALAAATAASRTTWTSSDNYTATYVDGDGWSVVTQ